MIVLHAGACTFPSELNMYVLNICVKIVPGIVFPHYLRTENILGQTEF